MPSISRVYTRVCEFRCAAQQNSTTMRAKPTCDKPDAAEANARYTVPALAVAATSPGYAAGYTYTDSTPDAVNSPPAQAASCAATTAATSKA